MSETQNDLLIFGTWLQVALIAVPALICACKLELDELAETSPDIFRRWHLAWLEPHHA